MFAEHFNLRKSLIHLRTLIIGLAVSLGGGLKPACAGPPYNVDDPATSEAQRADIGLFYYSSQGRGFETQQFPYISIGYGLTNTIELDFSVALTSLREAGVGRNTGLGDTALGGKWRFVEEKRLRPQMALAYQLKIPTASRRRELGSGCVDHTLTLSAAKSFGRASLFGNLGYNFLGGTDGKNNLFYGAGVTWQATEQLIVGAQAYGNTPNAIGVLRELAVGVGLTCNFAPDRSLLVQIGRSTQGFSDLNVTVGIAFTLGKQPHKPEPTAPAVPHSAGTAPL